VQQLGRAQVTTTLSRPPDAATPSLDAGDISAFCNVIGLAPRQLVAAREVVTERYDLGPRGAWILGLIERGVRSPSALTEVMRIGRSLTTSEINRLTEAGLVDGRQSAADGRRVDLVLTREGQRAADELRAALTQHVNARLSGFTREQVRDCIALLQAFTGASRIEDSAL